MITGYEIDFAVGAFEADGTVGLMASFERMLNDRFGVELGFG